MAFTSHEGGLGAARRFRGGWRSPLVEITIALLIRSGPQREAENAHGSVYWIGRARVKLHGCSDWAEWSEAANAGAGDERPGADRISAYALHHRDMYPRPQDHVVVDWKTKRHCIGSICCNSTECFGVRVCAHQEAELVLMDWTMDLGQKVCYRTLV
jgi:hypothetical protein